SLVIITRSPVQNGANTERFAQYVPHHVFRFYSLRRTFVMSAAGGMDVVISRVPTVSRWINPAPEPEVDCGTRRAIDSEGPCFGNVFGATAARHCKFAQRQTHGFTIGSVDLFLEKEIGSQTFRSGWVDSAGLILDAEGRHSGPPVFIA